MIRFLDGTEFETTAIFGGEYNLRGAKRECLELNLVEGYSFVEVSGAFVDGASFAVVDKVPCFNADGTPALAENGLQLTEEHVFEKAEYFVAGDITDKRDGTFTVLMGRQTAAEKTEEENAALLLMIGGELDG